MIYAYRKDNQWVAPTSIRSRFNGVGAFHTLTDEQRAKYGWYPCIEVNAQYNPLTHIQFPPTIVLDSGVVTLTYKKMARSLNEVASILKQDLASIRYDKEVGGVAFGGVTVATDRSSQAMLNAAVAKAKDNADFTVDWKSQSGFVTLDSATLIALGNAISDHVQKCFSAEYKVDRDHISLADTVDDLLAISVADLFDGYY